MRYFLAPTLEFLQNHVLNVQAMIKSQHEQLEAMGYYSIGVDYAPSRRARRALVWTVTAPGFTRSAEIALIGAWKTVDVLVPLPTIQLQLNFQQHHKLIGQQAQKYEATYDHRIGGYPTHHPSYRAIAYNSDMAVFQFLTSGLAPGTVHFDQSPPFRPGY